MCEPKLYDFQTKYSKYPNVKLFICAFSSDTRKELTKIWLNEIDYALAAYDGVLDVLGLAVEGFSEALALLGTDGGTPGDQHKDTWSEIEQLSSSVVSGISTLKSRIEEEAECRQENQARLETLATREIRLEQECAEKDAELQVIRKKIGEKDVELELMRKDLEEKDAEIQIVRKDCAEKDTEIQIVRKDRARLLDKVAGLNKTSDSVLASVDVLSERCKCQNDQLTELTQQNATLKETARQFKDTDKAIGANPQHKHCTCCKTGKRWVL